MSLTLITILLFGLTGVTLAAEQTFTSENDFQAGTVVGVYVTTAGHIQLSNSQVDLNFIWVPNQNGSVSKVDTQSGKEIGRYWTGPQGTDLSPSRTTVDRLGNVWVGNRNAGTVVKIGLVEAGQWEDRNNNGVLDTSTDQNNDGVISTDEMLPFGLDEAVLLEVSLIDGSQGPKVPGTYGSYNGNPLPRALAVDANNNLWVGSYNYQKYYYINGISGNIEKTINVSGHTPYGAVIDNNGILWSSSLNNHVLKIDVTKDQPTLNFIDLGYQSYGIGIDNQNHIFVAGTKIARINASTNAIEWSINTPAFTHGIATSADGDVWAVDGGSQLFRYDNNGNYKTTITVGASPKGVAVDKDGYIWVCDLGDDNLHKIDPGTNAVIQAVNLAGSGGHYSYSDMTGAVSQITGANTGYWTGIFDGKLHNFRWNKAYWSSVEPAGTSITVKVRASNDQIYWSPWVTAVNNTPFNSYLSGKYLEVQVKFQGDGGDAVPVLNDLTVVDRDYEVANIVVEPQTTKFAVGETTTFNVYINNAVRLYGADIVLRYDQDKMEYVPNSLKVGDTIAGLTVNTFTKVENGKIFIGSSRSGDDNPYNGDGQLLQVAFTGKNPGGTGIYQDHIALVDSDDRPIPLTFQQSDIDIVSGAAIEGRVRLQGVNYYAGDVKVQLADASDNLVAATLTEYSGYYRFDNDFKGNPIAQGTYKLFASRKVYLNGMSVPFNVYNGNSLQVPEIRLLTGDIQSDNKVDLGDFINMANIYSNRYENNDQHNWQPLADLNRDNWISIFDLVLLAKNYGKNGADLNIIDTKSPTAPPSVWQDYDLNTGYVNLNWSAATDNVGVVGYAVYRADSADGPYQLVTKTPNLDLSEYLLLGKTYYYQVRAYDADGNYSLPSNMAVFDFEAPAPPLNLNATEGNSNIYLTWSAAQDKVGVSGYYVNRRESTEVPFVRIGSSGSTDYYDSYVTPGVTYYYQVLTYDGVGHESTPGNTVSMTIASPTTPQNLTATVYGNLIDLSWNASSDNTKVSGYRVYQSTIAQSWEQIADTAETGFRYGGVPNGTKYNFYVLAYDTAGNVSEQSDIFSVTLGSDTTPPTAPTGLQANLDGNIAYLSWNASTDTDVQGYKIYLSLSEIGPWQPLNDTAGTTTTVAVNPNGSTYYFRVKAFDTSANFSDYSNLASVTTQVETPGDTVPPTAPGSLGYALHVDNSEVYFHWEYSSDNIGVVGYDVYRAEAPSGSFVFLGKTNDNYINDIIDFSKNYIYQVRAYDAAGNYTDSTLEVITTPPPAPTNLVATAGGSGDVVNLTWSELLNPNDIEIYEYKIYRSTSPTGTFDLVGESSGPPWYSDHTVNAGTTYYYQVKAINMVYNISAPSSTVSVDVPASQTATVTSVTISGLSSIQANSSYNFQATAHYSDLSESDVTNQATWESDNPSVASITGSGQVTTNTMLGTVNISATYQGVNGSFLVSVN